MVPSAAIKKNDKDGIYFWWKWFYCNLRFRKYWRRVFFVCVIRKLWRKQWFSPFILVKDPFFLRTCINKIVKLNIETFETYPPNYCKRQNVNFPEDCFKNCIYYCFQFYFFVFFVIFNRALTQIKRFQRFQNIS